MMNRLKCIYVICTSILLLVIPNNGFTKFLSLNFTTPVFIGKLTLKDKKICNIIRTNKFSDTIELIQEADFTNAYFASNASFDFVHFSQDAFFISTTFDSIAKFDDAHFSSVARFDNTKFHSFTSFVWTRFDDEVGLGGVYFDSFAKFDGSIFNYYVSFEGTTFGGQAWFDAVKFNSTADFRFVKFRSKDYFDHSHFNYWVYFDNASFDAPVSFRFDTFTIGLSLTNIETSDNARFDFSHCILPDTIDLSYNPYLFYKQPLFIDFTLSEFPEDIVKKKNPTTIGFKIKKIIGNYFFPSDTAFDVQGRHLVNIYYTDISKLKLDYIHFKLYFQDIEDTTTKELSDDNKAAIYEQLLKNFKDHGQDESYKKLDIEYQRFIGRDRPFLTAILDWWWRFGYEKARIFVHSFLFILMFSIFNFFWMHRLNDKNNGVYNIEKVPEFSDFRYSKHTVYQMIKRLWFSIVYTSIIFFLLSLKIEKVKFSKLASLWIMFIYVIGLICMGFMANLILQK